MYISDYSYFENWQNDAVLKLIYGTGMLYKLIDWLIDLMIHWSISLLIVCVKGVVVEKDGVKKTSVLTADAVELGRRMLDLSCVIANNVCIIHTTIHYTTEYYV